MAAKETKEEDVNPDMDNIAIRSLIQLLIDKGVITKAEIDSQIHRGLHETCGPAMQFVPPLIPPAD